MEEFLILGDMSSAINVLFDLDFQKLVGKIWKQKSGILIIVVFSKTEEGSKLFCRFNKSNQKENLENV